jgi:predicted alpha/beta-fold hydrolase
MFSFFTSSIILFSSINFFHFAFAGNSQSAEPRVKIQYIEKTTVSASEKSSESDILVKLAILKDKVQLSSQDSNSNASSAIDSDEVSTQGVITNIPNAANKNGVTPECNPYYLQKTSSENETASEFAKRLNFYFAKCGDQLHKGENGSLAGLIEFARAKYDPAENEKIKKVSFKFNDGTTVNGYMLVKDNKTKRPWVILKCGVFCSANFGPSVSNFTMALFDQSPFNLIVLENRTGTDHILSNSSLTIGGYLESYDFFMIGRWLKEDSEFKETVESLHIMGVSLAGNAALFAAYLSPDYKDPDKSELFDSVTAICPVVNLKPTIDNMYADNLKGAIFSRVTWSELSKVKKVLTEGSEYFDSGSSPKVEEFPVMLGTLTSRYASKWADNPKNESKTKPIRTIEDLWQNGQFTTLDLERIKVPLFVWASKDDVVVNNPINTKNLSETEWARTAENVGIVNLPLGNHCAFSTAYGYNTTAQVLKSFVLNNSHNFKPKQIATSHGISLKKILKKGEFHLHQIWSAKKNSPDLNLTFEVFSKFKNLSCSNSETIDGVRGCLRRSYLTVKKSTLGLGFLENPKNTLETEIQTRWLNTNVVFKGLGDLIDRSTNEPDSVEWTSYP